MTGHVLIVDPLATNRIVLKAKLSAAYYVVSQATTARDATKVCLEATPDLVILGHALADAEAVDLIRRLERVCAPPSPPVLMLLSEGDSDVRLAALQAGAADVMVEPLDDDELFARLRALLRQRRLDCDLVMHVNTASALGFAEDPLGFSGPERAVVLASLPEIAKDICDRLKPYCRYDIVPGHYGALQGVCDAQGQPDIALLHIGAEDASDGLRSLAELQACAHGRDIRAIALTEREGPGRKARLLDMGACDVIDCPSEDRELAFRMTLHMVRKKRSDTLRGQLENGLQAAVLDPLTGLHNRRYANVFLRRLMEQAEAAGSSFAVMIADLDHFKRVNDTHGHAAGDRVLIRTAGLMRDALPSDAMIARVGGEEFLIVVPDTTLPDVRALAGRLGRAVRETPVSLKGRRGHVHVTVSIGATVVDPARTHRDMPVEALIDQADKALYRSKTDGRDTVTVTLRPAA